MKYYNDNMFRAQNFKLLVLITYDHQSKLNAKDAQSK